ncbi:hypothetical protein IF1G_07138 [Cordyceps javanica]|uniref:Uncharacterized protein n=1 Tax=Cordyceps javanica TaxID=43265 RepID=A0A545UXR9_9HYPO|nr:hypothetical protein IF1G_07138 [Cordyceps javanica]
MTVQLWLEYISFGCWSVAKLWNRGGALLPNIAARDLASLARPKHSLGWGSTAWRTATAWPVSKPGLKPSWPAWRGAPDGSWPNKVRPSRSRALWLDAQLQPVRNSRTHPYHSSRRPRMKSVLFNFPLFFVVTLARFPPWRIEQQTTSFSDSK